MAKFSKFRIDKELESKGVWVDYEEDIECLIGRVGNPEYQAFITKATRDMGLGKITRRSQIDTESPEFQAMQKEAAAHHLLFNWRGVDDEDAEPVPTEGADHPQYPSEHWRVQGPTEDDPQEYYVRLLPYSPEKGLEYFDEYPDFYRFIILIGGDNDRYLVAQERADSKN